MTTEQAIKLLDGPVYKWSLNWDDRDDGLKYCDAIQAAIDALKEKLWRDTLWHDFEADPPKNNGLCYVKKDDSGYMWACDYKDGEWFYSGTFYNQKFPHKVTQWADYAAFQHDD